MEKSKASSKAAETPKKALKCALEGCDDAAVKSVGDCRACAKCFCPGHALPVIHGCTMATGEKCGYRW